MFFRPYSELLSKFGTKSFQEYVSEGITHPVFYGDLVYKLRRVKGEANFISSGSKIVKRLRRRHYDPAIIERTIGLVLGPYTTFYRSFLKRCTLTRWLGLYDWPCQYLLKGDRLIVSRDSFSLWPLACVQTVRSTAYFNGCPYIFLIYKCTIILLFMVVYHIFKSSPLWLAVGPQSLYFKNYLHVFK